MSRELTLVLPHYGNLGMLREQQRVWASYPEALRAKLHVIVVDDCSPKGARPSHKVVDVTGLASFRIFRLQQKKRWNWLACRNLGAQLATTDWLLLTDIDHVMPVDTAMRLIVGDLVPGFAYRFSRVTATRPFPYLLKHCTPYKPHNDSWLLTRQLFFYDDGKRFVLGYDERLSGCYGTSGEFKDRVMAAAEAYKQLPEVLVRYPREIIADASTPPSVYTRKGDPVNDEDLKARKCEREQIQDWRPLHGLVPYEEVYSSLQVEAVA